MTKQEQLRYEYFIETGIVWRDTNDNIEMDYLKWVENKVLTLTDVTQAKRAVCPDCFDRGELRNDKEEIIGTCPCHY